MVDGAHEIRGQLAGVDELAERDFGMGIRDHRAGAHLGSIGQRHANGAASLDQHASDPRPGADLGAVLASIGGNRL